jgi:hypothetical protein
MARMSAIFRQAASAFGAVGASGSGLSFEDPPHAVMISARASAVPARFTRGRIRPQLLPFLWVAPPARSLRRSRRPSVSA